MNLINCFVDTIISCVTYKDTDKFLITYTANCYGRIDTFTDVISEKQISLYVKGYEVLK
jgi:hypothetical protein